MNFEWVTGNAESLPFPDNSFDVYTIAFGLRNVTHIDNALKEAARVLKPGGRFFCMEFSRVESAMLSKAYDAWSFHVIPKHRQIHHRRPGKLPVPRREHPQIPQPPQTRPPHAGRRIRRLRSTPP
jgi:ubiquinone/menaquinone biosynthesis C-methylase UbiE